MRTQQIYGDDLMVANEAVQPIRADLGGNNQPGEIYFANESRFIEATFSEPLTQYAVGYKDPGDIQGLLDFIAPAVPTTRRFEYFVANNPEEFATEVNLDDVRSIGASFKKVEYTSSKALGVVYNKGLTICVDLDNVEDQPMWREIQTGKLMRRLLRAEAMRAYSILSALATNTNIIWNGTQGQDPDMDLRDAINLYGDSSGLNPNKLLMGLSAWTQRIGTLRAQNNPGGYSSANFTPQQLADSLMLNGCFVSRERYTATATTKSRIIPNTAIVFLANDSVSPEDPSNLKRFISNTAGGTPFRVYEQVVSSKLVHITVEHYSNILPTANLGVQQLTVTPQS